MRAVKRTVMFTVILLACAGVYGALRNLPVVSGCAFYGECPTKADAAKRITLRSRRRETSQCSRGR